MAHTTPDLLALSALGEDVDPKAVDHVASCRICFAEIEALQQVVAVCRSLEPDDRLVAPHPRVWQRVEEAIGHGRVVRLPGAVALEQRPLVPASEPADGSYESPALEPPVSTQPEAPARLPDSRRRWSAPALAAAAALVVGLGGGYALKGLLDPARDVAGVTTQLNALPRWSGANGTASVEKGPDGQRTLVITMQVPGGDRPEGTFEVWMSDSQARDMVPMGTMKGASDRFLIPASVDLNTHPIVDVSLEPPGDSDPAHSDVSVLRGRLVR